MRGFDEYHSCSEHTDEVTVSVRGVDELSGGEGEDWVTRVWQNGYWRSVPEHQGRNLD